MQQGANQPKGPPANVEQRMAEMFPDLELTAFIREHRNLTPEALASLIVDRRAQIPKKRKRTENGGAAAERQDGSDSDSDVSTGASEDIGDLLIDKFLAVLIHKLKVHIREGQNAQNRNRLDMYKRQYLTNKFISVRTDFIDKMLFLFHQALFPTAIACFIAEHNYANKLRPVAPDLNQKFWQRSAIPMTQKRRFRPRLLQTTREIEREFNRFMDAMRKYSQGKYAELFNNDLKLRENHNQVRWNRPEPQQKIECRVCFEKYPAGRMTYCTAAPVPKATTASQPPLKEDDKDKAGPSSKEEDGSTSSSKDDDRQQESAADTTTAMDDNAKQHQQQQTEEDVVAPAKTTSSEDGRSTDGESAHDPSTHPFCRHCIRGQAQAATQQQPLAEGGVGLCCMVPGCKNPILYSDVRPLLSAEICKKLDERIIEENLGMALLSNLERCKRCNYAVIMEVDKRINKVFQCLKCDAKFCRICENDWDDDHFGVSCEEVDQKLKRDRKDRDLEKQLNEAIIRKCPRCGVAFMKDQGCNKMTCRCGMTSCYICRATRIDYGHFCQHIRNPNNPDWKCQDCNKKCLLFEDPKKRDERLIAQIRQEWAERMQREREQQLANAHPGQQQPQQRNAPQPPPRPIRPPAFVRE